MGDEIIVEAENLTFRYMQNSKKNILNGVSAAFRKGTMTVLMGASGCGKSTLAALLAGLYPENAGFLVSGEIRLLGKPITEYSISERARHLAVMFQNPDLQFTMQTLRQEMRFVLENISYPSEAMDAYVAETAGSLGLEEMLDRRLFSLSGGEKQKAALACIFLLKPEVILLDEPFANIDNDQAEAIADRLTRLNREEGVTVIAIDHSLDHWLSRVTEVRVMKKNGTFESCADNLTPYRSLFESEGLRYPREVREHIPAEAGLEALRCQGMTIYTSEKRKKDRRALYSGDAVFYSGQMTALLGESGAGKTSFFRTLLGTQDYEGSILVGCRELRTIKGQELYQEIGIVFQNPSNQFITQNVEQEVMAGMSGKPDPEKADTYLEEFGLKHFRRRSPYMLSQGQQRRLAVLAALSSGQKILLLDEPTYGQDDAMTEVIMKMVHSRMEQEGLTVIFTTHDTRLTAEWADRCYMISGGRIHEADPRRREVRA